MKIEWMNETRKLSELIPWPRNPRQVKVDQVRRLQESLDEFGQPETIAIGPGNELYNGHQRLKSWADKFGDIDVDVRVSNRALTEKEREKLTVFLHKGAAGEWDFDILANEFEVDDLLDWGFDEHELDLELWGVEPEEDPGAQIDRAEELREKWGVESGQLWRLGEHRLICGDCTDAEVVDRVMDGERVDLLLTDPPYGISIVQVDGATDGGSKEVTIGSIRGRRKDTFGGKKNMRGTVGSANWVDATPYRPVEGDDKPFEPEHLMNSADNLILFGANYYASKLPDSRCWIVWDKNNTGNFADAELAWTSFEKGIRLYEFTWNGLVREGARDIEGIRRVHPTQKPVGLFEMILDEFSESEEIIADWYLGSGTTLIACERLGRKCRAVEISPAYCAVAIQRWVDMTSGEPELMEPVIQVESGG